MSEPSQIEARPPRQGREGAGPARLPQRLVRRVEVSPEDIYPKDSGRRRLFSFELIVSRYILFSAVAVVTLMVLLVLSEMLFRR